jgi:hypothetical protein
MERLADPSEVPLQPPMVAKRRLWVLALALTAIAIAGASAAAATVLLDFRDPRPDEVTFPKRDHLQTRDEPLHSGPVGGRAGIPALPGR